MNLNDKEIKIYLSLLTLGQATVNKIAKQANLNRVSTYDVLDTLLDKGFVSYVIISGVKNFEAATPNKFIQDLKEKQAKIKAVLPELEKIRTTSYKKPQIEMYEEINGLKSIFADILKEATDTLFIGDPDMLESLQFYFPHFIKEKRQNKLFSKVITYDSTKMRKYQKKAPEKFIEMRFIDKKIEMTKIIYANKVAFLTFKESNSIGVLINNKEIANTERQLFELQWNKSKK